MYSLILKLGKVSFIGTFQACSASPRVDMFIISNKTPSRIKCHLLHLFLQVPHARLSAVLFDQETEGF